MSYNFGPETLSLLRMAQAEGFPYLCLVTHFPSIPQGKGFSYGPSQNIARGIRSEFQDTRIIVYESLINSSIATSVGVEEVIGKSDRPREDLDKIR